MELLESFWALVRGIIRRLYWLVPALFTDPFDFLERWFNVTYPAPAWLFWVLLSVGFAIAIALTYHELRTQHVRLQKQDSNLKKQLSTQERDYTREALVKLREPLKNISSTLVTLQKHIEARVTKVDVTLVRQDALKEVTNHIVKYAKQLDQPSIEFLDEGNWSKMQSELRYAMDGKNIGVTHLLEGDKKAERLLESLLQSRSYVSDGALNGYIERYLDTLYNLHSAELWLIYSRLFPLSSAEQAIMVGKGRDYVRTLLGVILTEINKRIEQLIIGKELQ